MNSWTVVGPAHGPATILSPTLGAYARVPSSREPAPNQPRGPHRWATAHGRRVRATTHGGACATPMPTRAAHASTTTRAPCSRTPRTSKLLERHVLLAALHIPQLGPLEVAHVHQMRPVTAKCGSARVRLARPHSPRHFPRDCCPPSRSPNRTTTRIWAL